MKVIPKNRVVKPGCIRRSQSAFKAKFHYTDFPETSPRQIEGK